MSATLRRSAGLAVLIAMSVAAALGTTARAHDFSPGVLSLAEREHGVFHVRWVAPVDTRRPSAEVTPRFDGGCDAAGERLDCGPEGLRGEVWLDGDVDARTRVLVAITTRDGETREVLLSGDAPRGPLSPSGPSWLGWFVLGIEHIVGGLDHLAFLAGLLLLSGLDRRVIGTVTAFTVAHSITLGLAALELVRVPSAPVEAAIAASVVLLAREALRDDQRGDEAPTLARRAPWTVALLFGLVHGLGFAGALAEIGLPRGNALPALAAFNLGVEFGQLAIVLAVVLVVRVAAKPIAARPWLRTVACYGLGVVGALWSIERVLGMLS